MKRLLLSLALIFYLNANAQTTVIPDVNFEQILINLEYDDVLDGSVLTSNIIDVKELFIGGYNISDLRGIQDFKSLKKLYCNSNNLSSLDISHNDSLISLHCQYNRLTYLDISNNKLLVDLDCSHNLIKSVNVKENKDLDQTSFNEIETESKKSKKRKPTRTLFDNALFVDGMFGFSSATVSEVIGKHSYSVYNPPYTSGLFGLTTNPAFIVHVTDNIYGDVQRSFVTLNLKIGNKWYGGSRENWRLGFQATWLKLGALIPSNGGSFQGSISLANIGFTNMFKLSEVRGIEFNATFGYNLAMNSNVRYETLTQGVATSIEVKLRIKQFAVGLDYSNQFNAGYGINTISMSVGGNF